jgi:hypothetical protein
VSLMRPDVVSSLDGNGTGKLSAHLDGLKSTAARLYLSGMLGEGPNGKGATTGFLLTRLQNLLTEASKHQETGRCW